MSTTMEQVKERPIPFSSPMVTAIREGRKTQTRRTLKLPMQWSIPPAQCDPTRGALNRWGYHTEESIPCPYGRVGNRLYVTEHWSAPVEFDAMKPRDIPVGTPIWYRADPPPPGVKWGRFRVGRFMCRWMSRITLKITAIRVQRAHDISDADVRAEGVDPVQIDKWRRFLDPRDVHGHAYGELWDSVNGKGAWAKNPWVWAISFRVAAPAGETGVGNANGGGQ